MNWNEPTERAALAVSAGPAEYNRQFAANRSAAVIEHCAGHALRFAGSRFGQLVAVGDSGRAFSTIEQARQWAGSNPLQSTDSLTAEYGDWLAGNGLEPMCAAELLAISFSELDSEQTAWLRDFCERWEAAQSREDGSPISI